MTYFLFYIAIIGIVRANYSVLDHAFEVYEAERKAGITDYPQNAVITRRTRRPTRWAFDGELGKAFTLLDV